MFMSAVPLFKELAMTERVIGADLAYRWRLERVDHHALVGA